jgi:hypothetical protein
MGVPNIKAKRDLNYRRKSASRSCADCDHAWHPSFDKWPRCEIIGLGNGRAYRISPNCMCDKHDNSKYMEMLLRGSCFAKKESSP